MTDEPAGVSLLPNKGGRPRKLTADKATVDHIIGMASIFCTKAEVAAVLRVARPTLDRFFEDNPEVLAAYEDGFGTGKMSLKRKQFKLADKNAAMAIFLGKNYLGQKDRQEHVGADGGAIRMQVDLDLSGLTDEELAFVDALQSKLAASAASPAGSGEGGDSPAGSESRTGED